MFYDGPRAEYILLEVIAMSESENPVVAKWNELKVIMEALELDVAKNAKGVAAAGVRARKGLRSLKAKASELVKTTVDLDKDKRAAKPAKEPKAPKAPKTPKA